MKIIEYKLETPRLTLRELTQSDYPALAAILQDEPTMYAYNGAFNGDETKAWLDTQIQRYHEDGFGLWAVILKENGLMIGQAGLSWQNVDSERVPEIGYLFNHTYWSKGYATEAARACKEYAFENLSLNEVYSIIRDTNIPSINVAIRNGMLVRRRFIKYYRGVNMPHFLFSIRKED